MDHNLGCPVLGASFMTPSTCVEITPSYSSHDPLDVTSIQLRKKRGLADSLDEK